MIRNFFKTAWRNIVRSPLYSGINMLGLTIGLAVGMMILLWVQDETSFDAFHHKAATLYRVNSPVGMGASRQIWDFTQAPVAPFAVREIPGVVGAVRFKRNWLYSVYSYQDKLFDKPAAMFADSNFLQVLDFQLLKGNVREPWPNEQSVLITASTAKKYFGADDPMGKVILGDHKAPFVVSGVLADFPDNSSISADMLFPLSIYKKVYDGTGFWKSMDGDWGNFGFMTILEVQPGVSTAEIGRKLIGLQMREAPHIKVSVAENAYQLQPLPTIHLRQADGSTSQLQSVRIFFLIAVLILLIASINYVNLSTARAMLRAREVGVRKIIGAAKGQLFAQFVVETAIFYAISLVLAFGLIYLLIPAYNSMSEKHFQLDIGAVSLWRVVGLTGLGVLVCSSVYPALLLSSFEPLRAIKGLLSRGTGSGFLRRALVTTQFVFSVGLIIGTLVIGRQLRFIRERDPGYDRSQVFTFWGRGMQEHSAAVLDQLRKDPAIEAVATATTNIVTIDNTNGGADWDGKTPNTMLVMNTIRIDERFLPMMKVKMAAGSNFSGSPLDSAHFILNETAVRLAGISNPVGKRFQLDDVNGTIVGVVKDFNFASLHEAVGPLILQYVRSGPMLYVKTKGRKTGQAIAAVSGLYERYNPGIPFDYSFLDQRYERLYRTDLRMGSLFQVFAGIAIFLSCLGLFGLATYTAQVRTREIGIRKVLGASVSSIVLLLSGDFLRLVLLAIVIAGPVAGWGMSRWSQDFVYRISIGWWVFAVAGAAALVLALLTIGWQAVRAALANPVKALRSE